MIKLIKFINNKTVFFVIILFAKNQYFVYSGCSKYIILLNSLDWSIHKKWICLVPESDLNLFNKSASTPESARDMGFYYRLYLPTHI